MAWPTVTVALACQWFRITGKFLQAFRVSVQSRAAAGPPGPTRRGTGSRRPACHWQRRPPSGSLSSEAPSAGKPEPVMLTVTVIVTRGLGRHAP